MESYLGRPGLLSIRCQGKLGLPFAPFFWLAENVNVDK